MQAVGPKERVSPEELGISHLLPWKSVGSLVELRPKTRGFQLPTGPAGEKDIYQHCLIFLSQIGIPNPLQSLLLPRGSGVYKMGALCRSSPLMELSAA